MSHTPPPAALSARGSGGWGVHARRTPLPLGPSTDAFSAAISQMYLGKSANLFLPRHGLNGPISTEHLRSRTSSISSQATRRGPLRADHTLQTPRSANDREIEEINRAALEAAAAAAAQRARPRVGRTGPRPRPRPLSAQLHPTYFSDLTDDTDPALDSGGPSSDSSRRTVADSPSGGSRRRVYLIKRPHSAPVYGRITPVSCRSDDGETSSRTGSAVREEAPLVLRETTLSPQRGVDLGLRKETKTPETVKGGVDSEETLVTADRGGDRSLVSPVCFIEEDSQSNLHREGSIRVRPRYVKSECVENTTEPKTKSPNDEDLVTDHTPVQLNTDHLDSTRQSSTERLIHRDTYESATRQSHQAECDSVNESGPKTRAVSKDTVQTKSVEPAIELELSDGGFCDNAVVSRLGVAVNENTSESVPLNTPVNDSCLAHDINPDSCSNSSEDRSELSRLGINSDVRKHRNNASNVCDQESRTQSSASEFPALRTPNPVSASQSVRPSLAERFSPKKEAVDAARTLVPPSAKPVQHSHKSSTLQTTYPSKNQVPASAATLDRTQPSSGLRSSRLTFGSLDNLLVGIDAETLPSPKKTKNKKSQFKSWFSAKKGKYNPGDEPIPSIETILSVREHTNRNKNASACNHGTDLDNDKESSTCPVLNTPKEDITADSRTDSSYSKAAVEQILAQTSNTLSLEADQSQVSDSDTADTMDGSTTKHWQASKSSNEVQQETVLTSTMPSSSAELSGDQSMTSRTFTSSKTSVQTTFQQQSVEKVDFHSTSSSEEQKSIGSDRTLSLVSSKILKGSSSGSYENTSVAFNSNVTRREMITIQGSSLNSYDKSVMLNDSGFPEDLTSTFKAKPVMVRERKISSSSSQDHQNLSSRSRQGSDASSSLSVVEFDPSGAMKLSQQHGSTEDLEFLSKAKRMIQSQNSDEEQSEEAGGEPELVVIREYVFTTKRLSSGDGAGAAGTETSSEIKTVSSSSSHASLHSSMEAIYEEKLEGNIVAVKEVDSGLDSPPSMQESLPLPVKPKRSGHASIEDNGSGASQPSTEMGEDSLVSKNSQPEKLEHATNVDAQSELKHTMTSSVKESTDSSQELLRPEAFINKLFADEEASKPGSSSGTINITSDEGKSKLAQLSGKNGGYEVPVTAATPTLANGTAAPKLSEASVPIYAVPDKRQNRKKLTAVQQDMPEKTKDNTKEDAQKMKTTTDGLNEEEIKMSSSPAVMAAPLSLRRQHEKGETSGDKENTDYDQDPELPSRLSHNRDSLAEGAYNKPWDNDFSSIEDDIRNRITSTFPSAGEEDKLQETSSPEAGMRSTDNKNESSVKNLEENPSSSKDALTQENISVDKSEAETLAGTNSASVYADVQYGRDSPADAEEIALSTVAVPVLSAVPESKESSEKPERPPLPRLPPPSVSKTPREAKPIPHEKPHKSQAEEKASPLNHRKLKEKFKKVFSHSSEDKKSAKAEHKKGSPLGQKDEVKGLSQTGEEVKPQKTEQKKTDEDKKTFRIGFPKALSSAKEEPKEDNKPLGADLTEKDEDKGTQSSPDKDKIKDDSSVEQTNLLSVPNYEVKLPLSPKEARKLIKADKKNAAKAHQEEAKGTKKTATKAQQEESKDTKKNASKAQQDESKEFSGTEDPKVTSPKVPKKALTWIKKKLATKGKKTPRSKKYNINITGEEEEEEAVADVRSPGGSDDAHSGSDDSHDSGSSHSESDNEEEIKKPKKKLPFWGGKKNKKKAAEHESDSDSSAEESKSKLFSWSLGRKKEADSSDHEDNLPGSYKKTSDFGDDAAGMSGTFKKLSDTVPQSRSEPTNEVNNQNFTRDQPSEQMTGTAEAPVLKKSVDSPLHNKTETEIAHHDTDSKDTPSETGDSVNNSNASRSDGAFPALQNEASGKDVIKNNPLPSKGDTSSPKASAASRLFAIVDNETRDIGEYTELRKDATVQGSASKFTRGPRNAGYELARPLFLEEDDDKGDSIQSSEEKDSSKIPVLSSDKPKKLVKQNAVKQKGRVSEMTADLVTEDVIVRVQAARPIHQIFNSLEKVSDADLHDRPLKNTDPASVQPEVKYPPSPVPMVKRNKPPVLAKPKPKPEVTKENGETDAVVEDNIVPSRADENFRSHKLSHGADLKPKLRNNGTYSGGPISDFDSSSKVIIDPKNPIARVNSKATVKPLLDVDSNSSTGAAKNVDSNSSTGAAKNVDSNSSTGAAKNVDSNSSTGAAKNVDSNSSTGAAKNVEDSPRSNTDSDDSANCTYLDRSDFLNAAKTSWGLQDNKASETISTTDPKSNLDSSDLQKDSDVKEPDGHNANTAEPSKPLDISKPVNATDDLIKAEIATKAESKPSPEPQMPDKSTVTKPGKSSTKPSVTAPKPGVTAPKPGVTAPKPDVRPKLFAKPKGLKPKEDSKPAKEPESKLDHVSQPPARTDQGVTAANKSTFGGKPTPPMRQKNTVEEAADNKGEEVKLRFPKVKSPEPKPRMSLTAIRDSTSNAAQANADGDGVASAAAAAKQNAPNGDKEEQDMENPGLNFDKESTKSSEADDFKEQSSSLSSTSFEESLGDSSRTDPVTSSWTEGDTDSTPGPNVGDFTLSLDLQAKSKKSDSTNEGSQSGSRIHNVRKDSDLKDQPQGEGESELTDVTPLPELPKSDEPTPISESTPLSKSTPLPSDVTALMTSVDDVSAIQESKSSSLTTTKTEKHDEEEIYEPIFFENLKDPNLSRRLTEAPPVRPEKVGKRQKDPPEIILPEFDDDMDNMYDVPPSRRQFAFPKESSLPVMSVVEKRGSRTSLNSMISFEPEDSITPYATYHRPQSQYLKQDSDYRDDENPYMNDSEDLQDLSRNESSGVEELEFSADVDEPVHASLSEILLNLDKKSGKGDGSDVVKSQSQDSEVKIEAGVASNRPDKSDSKADENVVSKIDSPDSESSKSSLESKSTLSSDVEGADSLRQKNKTLGKETDDSSTKKQEDAKPDSSNDQYLQSAEYHNSVEEIDKLYEALEKEEEAMERQSSSKELKLPVGFTKPPLQRLLSFDEQRAELKPLKSKKDMESAQAEEKGEETTKSIITAKNKKKEKSGTEKEIQTTTTSSTETHTSVQTTTITVQSTHVEYSKVCKKAVHSSEPKKTASEPEKEKLEAQQPDQEKTDGKEKVSSAEGTVLPPVTGYSKLVDKTVHRGEEQQVKVKVEQHDSPQRETSSGKQPDGSETSQKDDDFSSFQLNLPETSLEAEVLQHAMYAKVMKDSSSKLEQQEKTSVDSSSKGELLPAEAQNSEPENKLSKVSTFLVSREVKSSPKSEEVLKEDSVETQKSPTSVRRNKPPRSPKPSKGPRVAGEPPPPPKRPGSLKDRPNAEKSENTGGAKSEISETTTQVSEKTTGKPQTPPVSMSSPKPAARTSTPKPRNTQSPNKSSAPPKPPVPKVKPQPRPKPRDASATPLTASAEVGIDTPTQQDVAAGELSEESSPGAVTKKDEAADPSKNTSSAGPVPSHPSAQHEEPKGHKKKRHSLDKGASARSNSDDESEETDVDDEDDDDEESDEEGEQQFNDGGSPPLPERKYRKKPKNKYNEYSNVIRVDSQKLKEARIRSLSRSNLTDGDKKDKGNKKMRNAVSMDGGLDVPEKKHKKPKKDKKPKEAGEETEKKVKKPFLLKSFKDLFGTKKKKNKEEKAEAGENEDNVYETVDDFPETKSKKEAAASKNTWPKLQKRRSKSDHSSQPQPAHHPPVIAVDSSHASSDIRPIGRLLQLNPDGTQLLELIRPRDGHLGVQLTQGNEETLQGKFVSGFVDKGTEKLLSGILGIGDQILKINDRTIDDCPLIEVHDIIDTQQRLKFLVYPADTH